MDTSAIVGLLGESLFLLIVFAGFFTLSMWKGRYVLVNVILALYLALLVALKFPYFGIFESSDSNNSNAIVHIVLFVLFTLAGVYLFRRHIPGDDYERVFEGFGTKLLLALMATILVMAYSYHALPVTDLITPGSPIQALFGPEQNFFWWLIAPLVVLMFL